MLYLIDPNNYHLYREDLDNMYRLRHKIFFEKAKWQVSSDGGLERDAYDEKNMHYLIYKDKNGIIRGCVRFIEMIHECMFDGPFKQALPDLKDFKKTGYWELSRLAIDNDFDEEYTLEMENRIAVNLIAGYLHFGYEIEQIECTLTVSYPNTIELLKSYGLIMTEVNKYIVKEESNEQVIVSAFPTLDVSCFKMLKNLGISKNKPILWHLISMYADETEHYENIRKQVSGDENVVSC